MSNKKVVIYHTAEHENKADEIKEEFEKKFEDIEFVKELSDKTPSVDVKYHLGERTFIVIHNSSINTEKGLKVLESLQNLQ